MKETISRLGKNIKEFSEERGVPNSTLYKIISEEGKDFRVSTLRQIIETVKRLEDYARALEKVVDIPITALMFEEVL